MDLLQTRLDAILPAARIGGRSVPLAPELFSIMADVRLALGQIDHRRAIPAIPPIERKKIANQP